ncbi:restriction endonuclease subunit S [Macrococcoides bohemicum]|uniref:restriction endonuclease subunit S n=1 Tax=Macrococcoides bohemicum TaxID=1903056 RepID=UPI001059E2C3|nr:restriction endonuclease subunit S [Macrococcus bohemicus]TDL33538.1 restriction endonuclease subunit S [Macrococcus bohemicus]
MTNKAEKRKVPELRFPEFSGEWERKKMRQLGKFISGGTPNRKKKEYWNGNIPWITTSEIKGTYINDAKEYITKEGLENSSAKFVESSAILIAMYGQGKTRGKSAILNFPAATNQACGIHLVENNDIRFVHQLYTKNYLKLRELSNNGSQKNLSLSLLSEYTVSIPKLNEQQKVGEFFSKLDRQIELEEKKLALLEEQKKGYMQKIFSQELRFKDENGEEYPEWEKKTLNDIGHTYGGLTNKNKNDFGKGDSFYILYTNIFNNNVAVKSGIAKVDVGQDENQNLVEKGDILLTISSETPNEVGMASLWDYEMKYLYLNSFCFGIRITNKSINPKFLAILLRSENMRKKIIKLSQGSTRFNLSKIQLMNESVNIPVFEEQFKISKFYTDITLKIEKEYKYINNLKVRKNSLLRYVLI